MKKSLFVLAAAAAVISLSAADFELKFVNGKANWGNKGAYLAKLVDQPYAGAEMASVVLALDPNGPRKDNGFFFMTPLLDVKGKKQVKVEGEFFASMSVASPTGMSVRTGVVWKKGPKVELKYNYQVTKTNPTVDPITPFKLPVKPGEYAPFSHTVPVMEGMEKAFVMIGFDQPDVVGKNAVAIKSLKVTVE